MSARSSRVVATHLYTYMKCPRAVHLDMHGDRSLRRPATEAEEFMLARGRDHETRVVEKLGYSAPQFPAGDFETGAQATLELLRAGVAGVHQGVLVAPGRLGIPDLLRREPGCSDLGDWHYVVGDVKSSARPRGDQILQLAFYSRLLARLQGRVPTYAYLILKDGREQNVSIGDYDPVLDDVEARIEGLLHGHSNRPEDQRPFLSRACEACRWVTVCRPELEAKDDLSLIHGMTRGLRQTLETHGIQSTAGLLATTAESLLARAGIDAALLRRLQRAGRARQDGCALLEERSRQNLGQRFAVVHLLTDAFADRVLWFGVQVVGLDPAQFLGALPERREDELPAFMSLLHDLPQDMPLLHYGEDLPRWFDSVASGRRVQHIEKRFVDMAKRLRGAAMLPGPAFGLDGLVRYVLQREPHRAGEAQAAAAWLAAGQRDRLQRKGQSDLDDLLALKTKLLDAF